MAKNADGQYQGAALQFLQHVRELKITHKEHMHNSLKMPHRLHSLAMRFTNLALLKQGRRPHSQLMVWQLKEKKRHIFILQIFN
jgi:hypothetical protein